MMIHFLDSERGRSHEAKGVNKIRELVFFMELSIDNAPSRQAVESVLQLGTRKFPHEAIINDMRTLARSPGFAALAILTLALGIGATTAIFSVVESVILAPLPFGQPDRLVMVRESSAALKREMSVSYPDLVDWRRRARSFDEISAVRSHSADLTSPGTPEHLEADQISTGFFGTLGVKLASGREFTPEEDQHNGAPVAIVSNRLWKSRSATRLTLDG